VVPLIETSSPMATRTDFAGLTAPEAAARLAADGPNVLPRPARGKLIRALLAQLVHLLALLLWVAAGLALLAGMPALAAAIVIIVVLNALFAFWQEYRADRSTQELQALLPAGTRVVRDGHAVIVDVTDLVIGDLVVLAAGDRVGADVEVVRCHALTLDESLVTGESGAVAREVGARLLTGTFVVQGEATAQVLATGSSTTLARISRLTASASRPPSPLTKQLDSVVRVVAVLATGTGVVLGAIALVLGLSATEAFLFGVGVSGARVPQGLLPTVTLSLARGAQVMAAQNALVRRLDAVETLGATTFICTDKTGTLTQNRMNAVQLVVASGRVDVAGEGYEPTGDLTGSEAAVREVLPLARAAVACVAGRVREKDGYWVADGDPMEAALHALLLRAGGTHLEPGTRRPYTAEQMISSCLTGDEVAVLGAPEAVLARCTLVPDGVVDSLHEMAGAGRRVLAVARRTWTEGPGPEMESGLELLGLVGLEDPPRRDVGPSLQACRDAGIRVAMITGDHPRTAEAIAREVGLFVPGGIVIEASDLPAGDREVADLLDREEGAVIARVSPADKLRIARALRAHGHVVAMTGDGVNDAPALREADVGVAMGASGSDVAREAADLVLLDDHFATIVTAVELGRSTFKNVRRFLTYHLTDNVAELTPFALWALSGGQLPLAISVLQVLALDIGADMLPALALGSEPPRRGIMRGRIARSIIDRSLLLRSLGVLGATEAAMSMAAFGTVLVTGGWRWGENPSSALLATASGTAFATIVVCQMANAYACRSTRLPAWRLSPRTNPLLIAAVGAQAALLVTTLAWPQLSELLGGSWPPALGWICAGVGAVVLLVVDGMVKVGRERVRRSARSRRP